MRKSEQIQLEKDIKVIDQARRIINKWRRRYLKMNERLLSQDSWCAHLKRNEREVRRTRRDSLKLSRQSNNATSK